MDAVQNLKRIARDYLVGRARLGDNTAQELLVNRYQTRFLRHAYRLLGDAEQARDTVQESWLDILHGLPRLRDDGAFPAWSFRIITRKCAKQIAGLQKSRSIIEAVSAEPSPSTQDVDNIEQAADGKPVHKALAKLPAEQRTAVALFYLEEMSVAEVAVALDIPVGTVKSRLMNARKKLRAALEGKEGG